MEIIVTNRIRRRELRNAVSEETVKLFRKVKETTALADRIHAPGLPSKTTLHKVYATTSGGARRLLFFCRHTQPGKYGAAKPPQERWVLLFYRDKADVVGRNMSGKNPEFVRQLKKNLSLALEDLTESTHEDPRYEIY